LFFGLCHVEVELLGAVAFGVWKPKDFGAIVSSATPAGLSIGAGTAVCCSGTQFADCTAIIKLLSVLRTTAAATMMPIRSGLRQCL